MKNLYLYPNSITLILRDDDDNEPALLQVLASNMWQAITQTSDDQVLWRHMASISLNGLSFFLNKSYFVYTCVMCWTLLADDCLPW